MGMILHFVFVLLGVLTSIVLVQTQDQSGFISIACGLPENGAYTEKSTGINYISDAKFISTGERKSVSPEDKGTYQQQFDYLRSFPSGVRNCYRINVTSGARYLIRASFLYGNYDGLNELPQFDLHLGVNLWGTVKFTDASLSINNELIHSPSLDYIHLCLVNTGKGIPFISTIELRILNQIMDYVSTPTMSLARFLRLDFGSITNLTYRYEEDLYDRLWKPYSDKQWTHISSVLRDNDLTQNKFLLPAAVMSTAATPIKASASLDFNWDADSVTNRYYFYLHFTEVQKLPANETRSFNVFLNGKFWDGPVVPQYRTTYTKYLSSAWSGYDKYQISLVRTESSPLPPIISALEVYLAKDFSQFETEKDDVDAITNIKIAYRVTKNWLGDPCAPVAYKWEGLGCSFDGAPRITSLNLSSSGLTGHIAVYISKLTMLEYLDLSNNSLRGVVPYFLVELSSLKVLNLENNNLTGSLPTELVERSNDGLLSLRLDGNPNNLYTPIPLHKRKKVLIPLVVTLVGIFILSAATLYFFRSRLEVIVMSMKKFSRSKSIEPVDSNKREFTYSEILSITNSFERVVGKGGFGTVYYGCIGEIQVAVKMLFPSAQGHLQFHTESEILTRVHHRCLTPFIGYCNECTKQALVYEYMTNGNLAAYLSGLKSYYRYSHETYPGSCDQGIPTKTFHQYGLVDESKKLLGWKQRLQIAQDSALGLEYLHSGCKPPIIHRDIKTRNILLNEQFRGKISDFGLSRMFPDECVTHVSTVIAGTPGYVDPEYNITNRLTEKSDVFSFGVVLLEIITGRTAILKNQERIHIIQWVNSMLADKGEIDSIMDPRLQGEYDTEIARKFVDVAMACVALRSINRPTMNQVVLELKQCLPWENLGSTSHGSIDIASVGAISGESSLVR